MYIARHACKQHKAIAEAEPSVRAWVQAKNGVGQPCRWCGLIYKQRAKAHQRACPVFWTCGHLLSLYYNLHPTGQTNIILENDHSGRIGTPTSTTGTVSVRGLQSLLQDPAEPSLHSSALPSRLHEAMDTNETDKRAPDSELDPATTPQPKYAKAAGKGEGAEQDKGLPRPSATARPEYASPRSQTLLGQSFKRRLQATVVEAGRSPD